MRAKLVSPAFPKAAAPLTQSHHSKPIGGADAPAYPCHNNSRPSKKVRALPCTGEELTPELLKEQAAQWMWRLRCTGLMLALPSLDEAAEDLKGLASYEGEHLQPGNHADALLEMAVGMAAVVVSTCSMAVMPALRLKPSAGMTSYGSQLMQPTGNC